jgi:hypothetical protein
MRKLESHALGADVRTAACQRLIGYREPSRQINRESWMSKLKSLHKLYALIVRQHDHTLGKGLGRAQNCGNFGHFIANGIASVFMH